jgi:hypothetical protein
MPVTKDTAVTNPAAAPVAENAGAPAAASRTTAYAKELGICQTCNHQPRCLFARAARRPIMFCDEFDNTDATQSAPAASQPRPSGHTTGQGPEPGLCVNCDTRLDCNHREPGTTVHECEEHR